MRSNRSVWFAAILILSLIGCNTPASVSPTATPLTAAEGIANTATPLPPTATPIPADTATPLPSATAVPSQTPTLSASPTATRVVYGPGNYPANINPLTGLPVSDPGKLALPPAMISISNFPVTARPQSGLSVTPLVYEVYVGYGMTRFLATVYGDMTAADGSPAVFGPIRSGRLPYESLRMLLNGFLMIASGDESVLSELKLYTNVWNPASNDVNGVLIDSRVVENTAKQYQKVLGAPALDGLVFDPQPPAGGKSPPVWG